MRAVLIAVATLLAVPALAQIPGKSGGGAEVRAEMRAEMRAEAPATLEAAQLRPSDGTPVVVDREALMQQLARINEKLASATGKAKKDKQLTKLLEDARADLKEVGRQVTNAPPARTEPQRPPPPPPQPTVQPITEAMLRSLTSAIRNEPFADDQLSVLEEAAATQYFLVAQAQQVLRHFSFAKDRLKAMRLLRPRLLDMENSFKLYESFEFSNDKDELKRILAAQ